jgi:hypothetical integral membrane protein (TIGR02206 family)
VPLFAPLHLSILAIVATTALLLSWLPRGVFQPRALGIALAANELVWWFYRYSNEGLHIDNLPLQLCDAAVWFTVAACLTRSPVIVEFAYFVGLAGAGMALLTPNLMRPWPSYPAVYFFLAHGGIVVSIIAVVAAGRRHFRPIAIFRSFGLLLLYASFVGTSDRLSGANFMFLLHKPESASPLDAMGPWPWYVAGGAAAGLALFILLWLPVRTYNRSNANGGPALSNPGGLQRR